MHIVVIGAGAVGWHLAERLSIEGQDVVVIESDPARAAKLQAEVDCLVITGNGASARTLEEARIGDAGLLIAVTSSDAVNVLACQAASRYDVPRKVARVEDAALKEQLGLMGVDVVIDPGESLAKELLGLIGKGSVSESIEFADGNLVLIGAFVAAAAPIANLSLRELREQVYRESANENWDWLVMAIIRNGETIIARGDTRVLPGDHLLVMSKAGKTGVAAKILGVEEHRARRVFLLGATRLAQLSAVLFSEHGIHTTLVDDDPARCREFATDLGDTVVVHGDPTDPRVLTDEGVDRADAVLALTGWDHVNVLGCLVAKALGAEFAVARFTRSEYVTLLAGVGIDAAVSSRLAAANAILRFVRRGHVHSVATFQDSDAEAIELEVETRSRAVGKTLGELGLSSSAIVGGVMRDGEVFVPHGDTVIEAADRLIIVALPEAIRSVESLFA
ncbi:Trk system potassium transporter TrkA [bacterium]|nr:Trk system potassium transporter TrkA [bacterium]